MLPSERIRMHIEESDMSYVELEKKTGISKSALQRYASGATKKIPITAIEKIAPVLGVTSAYLMGWAEDESTPDEYNPSDFVGISKETDHFVNQIPYEHYEKIMTYINNLSLEELIEAENYLEYLSQRRKNKGGE